MAMRKSGYNKSGAKKNDPNRAKFVEKYVKQNTKSADRPATKKQARNAYYLSSADDKKGSRGMRRTGGSTKTTSGSSMRTRADGTKAGSPAGRRTGMGVAGGSVRAGVGQKATYPGKSAGMAGASKESRVAGKPTRNPSTIREGGPSQYSNMDAAKELGRYLIGSKPGKVKGRDMRSKEGMGSTRAKTSSKAPRSAAKPTGARDRNRRTY
jgi:hypothetical protein